MKVNRLTSILSMFVTVIMALILQMPSNVIAANERATASTNENLVEDSNFVLSPGTVVSGDFSVSDEEGCPYEGQLNKVQILNVTGKPYTYRVYVPEEPEGELYAKIPNPKGIIIYPNEMLKPTLDELNFIFPKGTVLSGNISLYNEDGTQYDGEWEKVQVYSQTEQKDIYKVLVPNEKDLLYGKVEAEGLVIHPGERLRPILEDSNFYISTGTVISGDIYLRDEAGCPYEEDFDKIQVISATGKGHTYYVYVPGENGGIYLSRIPTGEGIMIHPGESLIIRGDLDFDYRVDVFDLVLAKKLLVKGEQEQDKAKLIAADFNSDGNFSVADVVLLQKWLLGQ